MREEYLAVLLRKQYQEKKLTKCPVCAQRLYAAQPKTPFIQLYCKNKECNFAILSLSTSIYFTIEGINFSFEDWINDGMILKIVKQDSFRLTADCCQSIENVIDEARKIICE